jgi:signal transduction histidine kinase
VRENAALRDLDVIAYAGIPLRTVDGVVLGSSLRDRPRAASVDGRRSGDAERPRRAVMTEIELRTALRRAEAARAEAALANRAKDDFLALVSHELRSPLAGIASIRRCWRWACAGPCRRVSARRWRASAAPRGTS